MSLNVLILGPQGSGKGTQAARIASEYGIPHIATGDMFRAAIAAGTPLGKEVEPILASGALVPDELTIRLIRERLSHEDAQRRVRARRLSAQHGSGRGARRAARRARAGRSTSYSTSRYPTTCAWSASSVEPEEEGRTDDSPEVIAKRLEIFHRETAPLIGYYLPRGIVVGIHGDRSRDEVWAEIVEALERVASRAGEPA